MPWCSWGEEPQVFFCLTIELKEFLQHGERDDSLFSGSWVTFFVLSPTSKKRAGKGGSSSSSEPGSLSRERPGKVAGIYSTRVGPAHPESSAQPLAGPTPSSTPVEVALFILRCG